MSEGCSVHGRQYGRQCNPTPGGSVNVPIETNTATPQPKHKLRYGSYDWYCTCNGWRLNAPVEPEVARARYEEEHASK